MNIFAKRIGAYLIDFLLVSLVVSCLIGNKTTNPDYDKYNKTYSEYVNVSTIYSNFIKDLDDSFKDKKITDEEYENIISKNANNNYLLKEKLGILYVDKKLSKEEYNILVEEFKSQKELIDKYYDKDLSIENYNSLIKELENGMSDINKKQNEVCESLKVLYNGGLTEKAYDELYKNIYDDYVNLTNEYSYKIAKYNNYSNIYLIVINILYFVVFVYFVNGVSLGKKIFKLQVVKKDGSKVGILNLLLRTLILTNIIFTIINILGICFLNQTYYIKLSYVTMLLSGIMEILVLIFVSYRKDARGIHDFVGNTKVISTKVVEE